MSIPIRYRYDTFKQKYRIFDTDTIVSKGSVSDLNQHPIDCRFQSFLETEALPTVRNEQMTVNLVTCLSSWKVQKSTTQELKQTALRGHQDQKVGILI